LRHPSNIALTQIRQRTRTQARRFYCQRSERAGTAPPQASPRITGRFFRRLPFSQFFHITEVSGDAHRHEAWVWTVRRKGPHDQPRRRGGIPVCVGHRLRPLPASSCFLFGVRKNGPVAESPGHQMACRLRTAPHPECRACSHLDCCEALPRRQPGHDGPNIVRNHRPVRLALCHWPACRLPNPVRLRKPDRYMWSNRDGFAGRARQPWAPRSRAGSSGRRRPGAKGAKSTWRALPSRISSLIASPVAGAFSMPQTLWPVAT